MMQLFQNYIYWNFTREGDLNLFLGGGGWGWILTPESGRGVVLEIFKYEV